MPEPTRASTTIAYAGKAIEDGVMDVRDFAPALLSVSQTCRAAYKSLNPDAGENDVTTYIQADIRKGSFEYGIVVTVAEAGRSLLSTLAENREYIADAKQLLEVIGLSVAGGAGALHLIKKLRGRKPDVVEEKDGAAKVRIDGDVYLFSNAAVRLATDPDTRRGIEGMMKPLEKPGISSFEVRSEGMDPEVIATSSDAFAFSAPLAAGDEAPEDLLADTEFVTVLGVIRPYLDQSSHRWGLHDGQGVRGYEIRDPVFLQRVASGDHRFGRGDALQVRVRVRSWRDNVRGLVSENIIVEVLKVIPAPKQQALFPPPPEVEPRQ